MCAYSYRSESIGFLRAALTAGHMPEAMPMTIEPASVARVTFKLILGSSWLLTLIIIPDTQARSRPTKPPNKLITTDSTRNLARALGYTDEHYIHDSNTANHNWNASN